jgi:hypothetical protein
MAVVDGTQYVLRRALPGLAVLRRTSSLVIVAFLVLAFLGWNSQACPTRTGTRCQSPVSIWMTSLDSKAKPPARPKPVPKPKPSTHR